MDPSIVTPTKNKDQLYNQLIRSQPNTRTVSSPGLHKIPHGITTIKKNKRRSFTMNDSKPFRLTFGDAQVTSTLTEDNLPILSENDINANGEPSPLAKKPRLSALFDEDKSFEDKNDFMLSPLKEGENTEKAVFSMVHVMDIQREFKNDIQRLHEKLGEKHQQILQLQQENAKVTQLKQDFDLVKLKLSALEKENTVLSTCDEKFKEEVVTYQEKINELESKVDDLKSSLDISYSEISKKKDALADLERKISYKEEEIILFQKQVHEETAKNDILSKDIDRLKNETLGNPQEIAKLQEIINTMEVHLQEKKNQLSELEVSHGKLLKACEELEDEKAIRAAESCEFQAKIKQLEERLELVEADYKNKLEKSEVSIQNLKEKLVKTENDHISEIMKFEESLDKLEKQQTSAIEMNASKKGEYERLVRVEQELREEVKVLLDKVEKRDQKLANKDKETETKLETLSHQLYVQYASKHATKVSQLKKSYDEKFGAKMQSMEMKLNDKDSEIASLKKQIALEREEKFKLVKKWETENV